MNRPRLIAPLLAVCALATTAAPAAAAPAATLVVGDSLAVGIRPHLGALLPDRALTYDVRSGRTTPQGLQALRTKVAAARPGSVVISLGTNDGPDPARFAERIGRVLGAVGPTTCVVWPSIVRPPRKGDATGLNRVLRRVAAQDPRLVVVDWVRAVVSGRVRLPDGLHPDRAGYVRRARMIAAAVRAGCAANPTDADGAGAEPSPAEPGAGGGGTGGATAP